MAGDVAVAVVSGAISSSATGTADFTKAGFGTPKACIIILTFDDNESGDGEQAQSKVSIGLSDFTNDYSISAQDEDAQAKVDCDSRKSNTKSYVLLTAGAAVDIDGTASTIADGVRLTNTTNGSAKAVFATVIMFGGADLTVDLRRTVVASSQDSTATIAHSGFTDGNDKLIFFIGTDVSAEDSSNTGINNSFGVCHATGADPTWTFVQRALGWGSDHNATKGDPIGINRTTRVLSIVTEAGGTDWNLEVTDLDHAPAEWTVTTREAGAGAGMEVYSLALDLDDRSAKVGSVDSPTSGATWTPSVSLGFTPQYVGLALTDLPQINLNNIGDQAGALGISSNTGAGEETCHSWYNEDDAATTNTNTLFRSRAIDLRTDDVAGVIQDHTHSSFNSGDWTYTIVTENETAAKKWFYWAIEEAPAAGVEVGLTGAKGAPSGALGLTAQIGLLGAKGAPSGALALQAQIGLTGAKGAPSGALGLTAQIALAGAKGAPSGAVAAVQTKPLTGAKGAPRGSLALTAQIAVLGSKGAPSGSLALTAQIALLGATGAPSGVLIPRYLVPLAGAKGAPSGVLALTAQIALTGVKGAPLGVLALTAQIALVGLHGAPSGVLGLTAQIALLGARGAPSGALNVTQLVDLVGAKGAPAGVLALIAQIALAGAQGAPSGALALTAQIALAGAKGAPSGALSIRYIIGLTGAKGAPSGLLGLTAQIAVLGVKGAPSGVLAVVIAVTDVALVGVKGAPAGDLGLTALIALVGTKGAPSGDLQVTILRAPGRVPLGNRVRLHSWRFPQ